MSSLLFDFVGGSVQIVVALLILVLLSALLDQVVLILRGKISRLAMVLLQHVIAFLLILDLLLLVTFAVHHAWAALPAKGTFKSEVQHPVIELKLS